MRKKTQAKPNTTRKKKPNALNDYVFSYHARHGDNPFHLFLNALGVATEDEALDVLRERLQYVDLPATISREDERLYIDVNDADGKAVLNLTVCLDRLDGYSYVETFNP